MAYRDSGGKGRSGGRRASGDADSDRPGQPAGDEDARLKQDFRNLKNEAMGEYRSARARIMKEYEERLNSAKRQYLDDAVASREKLLLNRQVAREEYEEALRNAKSDYEFAVDIVKDHYRTIRRETTRIIGRNGEGKGGAAPAESGQTRVIARLDEEIRKISEKKAEEEAKLGSIVELVRAVDN